MLFGDRGQKQVAKHWAVKPISRPPAPPERIYLEIPEMPTVVNCRGAGFQGIVISSFVLIFVMMSIYYIYNQYS